MSLTTAASEPAAGRGGKDIGFATVIALILCLFFLPVPAMMIDLGLALSIALSVLILMVALWIHKPLEFSAFPTVLLVATILRLALNISTTRLILSHGAQGTTAAGYIIGGFASLVMGGDFVIGIIVFLILVIINFLVITKGATRIAEVGARFTLDAIPGKQMAIDADLSAGLIDEKVAQQRRRELEEESAFFGSMDGASKFVRGDAIAGLIILAVNIFGGIVIGVTRHGLGLSTAADIFTKLSVGDGLVSQIPALIISLAAGMLVAKGGTRGSADKAVLDQLSNYPNALFMAALLMFVLGVIPGLPFIPFALLGGLMAFVGVAIPNRQAKDRAIAAAEKASREEKALAEARSSIKEQLKSAEIELCFSRELTATLLASHEEIASRVAKMRRKFARQYGFVVPEIKLTDDIKTPSQDLSDPHPRHCRGDAGIARQRVSGDRRRRQAAQRSWRRNPRAGFRNEGDFHFASLSQGREAGRVQADRPGVGPADAPERGDSQQSGAIAVLQGHARAARQAGARIQATHRRSLPFADFLFGTAGGAQAAARRARVHSQPESDSRGHRRDRAARAPSRADRRARARSHVATDLRRHSGPGRA